MHVAQKWSRFWENDMHKARDFRSCEALGRKSGQRRRITAADNCSGRLTRDDRGGRRGSSRPYRAAPPA
ncbi:hypothetical protein EB232_05920 [Mesorhizobium sp. NZP2077]|nr:hypothetical protein EB232_05920 [Mesorhizobium sp. NZP2077]